MGWSARSGPGSLPPIACPVDQAFEVFLRGMFLKKIIERAALLRGTGFHISSPYLQIHIRLHELRHNLW